MSSLMLWDLVGQPQQKKKADKQVQLVQWTTTNRRPHGHTLQNNLIIHMERVLHRNLPSNWQLSLVEPVPPPPFFWCACHSSLVLSYQQFLKLRVRVHLHLAWTRKERKKKNSRELDIFYFYVSLWQRVQVPITVYHKQTSLGFISNWAGKSMRYKWDRVTARCNSGYTYVTANAWTNAMDGTKLTNGEQWLADSS